MRPGLEDALPDPQRIAIVEAAGRAHRGERRPCRGAGDDCRAGLAGGRNPPGDGRPDDQHAEHDHGDERQVHPALRPNLGDDRHHARSRGERDEEPGREEGQRWSPSPQGERPGRQHHQQRQRRPHGGQGRGLRHSVVGDQRMRPDREAQVVHDHRRLRQQVIPRRHAGRETGAAGSGGIPMQGRQHAPAGQQGGIEPAAPAQGLANRAGREGGVVEQRHNRHGGDRFLDRRAGGAGDDGQRRPAATAGCVTRADDRIDRQQVAHRHHRLGPRDDVGDDLGVQRMHEPQQRHHEGDRVGRGGELRRQPGRPQRPAHDAPYQQTDGGVHGQVPQVVTGRIQAAGGIVERQRQADQRPPRHRALRRRSQRTADRAERGDVRIALDRLVVVEKERRADAGAEGEDRGQHQHRRDQPHRQTRRAGRGRCRRAAGGRPPTGGTGARHRRGLTARRARSEPCPPGPGSTPRCQAASRRPARGTISCTSTRVGPAACRRARAGRSARRSPNRHRPAARRAAAGARRRTRALRRRPASRGPRRRATRT